MKRNIIFILLFLATFIFSYSQQNNNKENGQIQNELFDSVARLNMQIRNLERKLNFVDSTYKDRTILLNKTLDSTNKYIDDTRLRESLKSAESTINKQYFLIDGYSYVIASMTILIAILTIIFSILLAKSNKQSEMTITRSNNATDRLNDRMDNFDEKINNQLDKRFENYEIKKHELELEEIFRYLKSTSHSLIKISLEKLSLNIDELTNNNINDLIDIILSKRLDEEEKTALIEILIRKNDRQILNFLKKWDDVRTDNLKLKETLLNYYLENNFSYFIDPITHFILSYAAPHSEFNDIITNLSSHPENIYLLLNHEPLIKSLTNYSKLKVKKFIINYSENWGLDKEQINNSLLFIGNKK